MPHFSRFSRSGPSLSRHGTPSTGHHICWPFTSANGQNHLSGLTYDIAGNVINDGNGNQPTYDAENAMATVAGVTYDYDAEGVRIEKSSGTMYWPGPSGTLAETDLSGNINEEYIYFNGQRVARVDRPKGAAAVAIASQVVYTTVTMKHPQVRGGCIQGKHWVRKPPDRS